MDLRTTVGVLFCKCQSWVRYTESFDFGLDKYNAVDGSRFGINTNEGHIIYSFLYSGLPLE